MPLQHLHFLIHLVIPLEVTPCRGSIIALKTPYLLNGKWTSIMGSALRKAFIKKSSYLHHDSLLQLQNDGSDCRNY